MRFLRAGQGQNDAYPTYPRAPLRGRSAFRARAPFARTCCNFPHSLRKNSCFSDFAENSSLDSKAFRHAKFVRSRNFYALIKSLQHFLKRGIALGPTTLLRSSATGRVPEFEQGSICLFACGSFFMDRRGSGTDSLGGELALRTHGVKLTALCNRTPAGDVPGGWVFAPALGFCRDSLRAKVRVLPCGAFGPGPVCC